MCNYSKIQNGDFQIFCKVTKSRIFCRSWVKLRCMLKKLIIIMILKKTNLCCKCRSIFCVSVIWLKIRIIAISYIKIVHNILHWHCILSFNWPCKRKAQLSDWCLHYGVCEFFTGTALRYPRWLHEESSVWIRKWKTEQTLG